MAKYTIKVDVQPYQGLLTPCGFTTEIESDKAYDIVLNELKSIIKNLTKHNSSSKKDCLHCIHINVCAYAKDMKADKCLEYKSSPS